MRWLSLNARTMQDEANTAEVYVVLFEITPPSGGAVIRLSTDPTERISEDPLVYGTRSSWRGANPVTEPFLFILASALLPSDEEDAPAEAQIVIAALDQDLVRLMLSYTGLATLRLAVVLASSPDLAEAEWADLRITSCDASGDQVAISFSREEVEQEFFPAQRMTRDRFPALP